MKDLFKNQSLTISSLFVSILSLLVYIFDLPIPQEEIVDLVALITAFATQLSAMWGRLRIGDLKGISGQRKPK